MAKDKKATAPKKAPAAKAATKAVPAAPVAATSFTLEGGIPIPARTRVGGASPYPFAQMTVAPAQGSTFAVAVEIEPALYSNEVEANKARIEEQRKIANRLSGAVRRFSRANPTLKFAVRSVEGAVRVWRTE